VTGQSSANGQSPRVLVVGSINMDLVVRSPRLPRPGETITGHDLREIPGGKGANQAVAAARLGAQVRMIGRVGDDAFGTRLRESLSRHGVDTTHVVHTPGCGSGVAVVAVVDTGENAITVIPGANGQLTPADVADREQLFATTDLLLLQLEIPLETVAASVHLARRHGVLTVLDPAPVREPLPADLLAVDLVCPNESEAAALTGLAVDDQPGAQRAACRLRELGARQAVVTMGPRGAVMVSAGGEYLSIPPFAVQAVDSTAAGDAFAAALGLQLALGQPHGTAGRFACAAGALAASRPGAQPAMPRRDEVEALMAATDQKRGEPPGNAQRHA
jgi:ribokinase